jgi:hypothetical protein
MLLLAQDKRIGRYRDYFGNRIELKPDSTFKYTWHFDLQSSWTKGTWTVVKDTVFLYMVPVFDTLHYTNRNNLSVDTLILSPDEKPERISAIDNSVLLSYGQNYRVYPDKLFSRKEKLYKIRNGSLVKKKQKGIRTSKMWNPWYFKNDD